MDRPLSLDRGGRVASRAPEQAVGSAPLLVRAGHSPERM